MATKKPKAEGYQIYVRVPHGDNASAEDISDFLARLAELLTDDRKDVTVLPYVEDDTRVEKVEPGADAEDSAAKTVKKTAKKTAKKPVSHAVGGPRSPLYPMYVCHNRN